MPSSTTLSARTTTSDAYLSVAVGFVKFNGEPRSPRIRQVRRCKYHSEPCTSTVAEDPCNANVKFDYRRVNRYFHYEHERLPSRNNYFLYFPQRTRTIPIARFEGITAETTF